MRAEEIKRSALENFVIKGYEATSLDDIVKNIRIKKQSIYSHFNNKEEIFLSVMESVSDSEKLFLNNFFNLEKGKKVDDVLYNFLLKYRERYLLENDIEMKFILRMAFIPPLEFQEISIKQFQSYNQELEKLLIGLFLNCDFDEKMAEEGMISFLNFLDGFLVELIYSGSSLEKIDRRLSISWNIYWEGFKNRIE